MTPGPDTAPRVIPEASVARLAVYLRMLGELAEQGADTVSSEELAAATGVNSAKLRKDLSYIGSHGIRGVGYDVRALRYQLERVLGLDHRQAVALVGVGNLGHALAGYGGFGGRGFPVTALFDVDPDLVGSPINGIVVEHVRAIPAVCAERGITIGMIATPGQAAQAVCDQLVAAGVRSILNFAPVVLQVPRGVEVRKVDLAVELQILAFHVSRGAEPRSRVNGHALNGSAVSADVLLPRRRRHDRARRRALPPQRARRRARAGRRGRRRRAQARQRDAARRARLARRCSSPPATASRSTPSSTRSTAASPTSPRCWSGTPAWRCPSSPSTSTCTTRARPCSTSSRWPPGSTRWSSARRRSSASSATPTPPRRARAPSGACCTSSPSRRCASASGCTPRPASTRAGASRRLRGARRRRARARRARRARGRCSSVRARWAGWPRRTCAARRSPRSSSLNRTLARAAAARRDHRRARHAGPRGHARRARRRARRRPTCWWRARARSARWSTVEAVGAARDGPPARRSATSACRTTSTRRRRRCPACA